MSKENKKIGDSGVAYKDVLKVTKIKKGRYNLSIRDGSEVPVSLNAGQVVSIKNFIRFHGEDSKKPENASQPQDVQKTLAPQLSPEEFDRRLERNIRNKLEVDLVDPNLVPFWSSISDLPERLDLGYRHAVPGDIVDYETAFAGVIPGSGLTPGGLIKRGELHLLVIQREFAERRNRKYEAARTKIEAEPTYIRPSEVGLEH